MKTPKLKSAAIPAGKPTALADKTTAPASMPATRLIGGQVRLTGGQETAGEDPRTYGWAGLS